MFAAFNRNAASMFSQLLDKKESGEFLPGGAAEEAQLPEDEPEETAAGKAEEE